MPAINALKRGELQSGLRASNRKLITLTREMTEADSVPVKEGAIAFRDEWKAVVGAKSSTPSAPGDPPKRRSGALTRSIQTAVVDGVRRVGSGLHTSRLLHFGVSAQAKPGPSRKGRRRGFRLVIAARPHANVALDRAAPKMTDVTVTAMQRRIAGGFEPV